VTLTQNANGIAMSELRTVQRFDETVLTNGYVGERYGLLPHEAQLLGTQIQRAAFVMTVAPTILDTVSSLPGVTGQDYDEGTVFTKYERIVVPMRPRTLFAPRRGRST
jgi:hypothetical protein